MRTIRHALRSLAGWILLAVAFPLEGAIGSARRHSCVGPPPEVAALRDDQLESALGSFASRWERLARGPAGEQEPEATLIGSSCNHVLERLTDAPRPECVPALWRLASLGASWDRGGPLSGILADCLIALSEVPGERDLLFELLRDGSAPAWRAALTEALEDESGEFGREVDAWLREHPSSPCSGDRRVHLKELDPGESLLDTKERFRSAASDEQRVSCLLSALDSCVDGPGRGCPCVAWRRSRWRWARRELERYDPCFVAQRLAEHEPGWIARRSSGDPGFALDPRDLERGRAQRQSRIASCLDPGIRTYWCQLTGTPES